MTTTELRLPTGHTTVPGGHCPNCRTVLPLTAAQCGHCGALFAASSSWHVEPGDATLEVQAMAMPTQDMASTARPSDEAQPADRAMPSERTVTTGQWLALLVYGHLGLGATFWGYAGLGGLLLSTVLLVVATVLDGPLSTAVCVGLALLCNLALNLAVWRAAKRYTGNPVWARLAQGVVLATLAHSTIKLILLLPA